VTATPLAAVLLAGGAARRADRDVATIPYLGGALIEHTVSVVGQRCDPVFVIAAPGQPLPKLDAIVQRDAIRGVGALLATGRGLQAAADQGLPWAFVCGVGMPYMDAALIDLLLGYSQNLAADVVLPWDRRDHCDAALYRTSLVGRIDALITAGERSMGALVMRVHAQRVVVVDSRVLTTISSAADLPTTDIDETQHGKKRSVACLYPMTNATAVDTRLILAYDAAQQTLSMQDTTLANLRTRANTLLATGALFTSFSAALGLINADPSKGTVFSPWKALVLLAVLGLLGVCVLTVLWTVDDWVFCPSAELILLKMAESPSPSEDEVRRYVITELNKGVKSNDNHLKARQTAFKLAVILLMVEVAALVVMLAGR
jgi:molybdopterin-guanine dinucleotide biosynthesis protein A